MSLRVKLLMVKKKVTQTSIARSLKVNQSTVSGVVNGHRKSRRIQQAIAEALHMDYHKVWGKAA